MLKESSPASFSPHIWAELGRNKVRRYYDAKLHAYGITQQLPCQAHSWLCNYYFHRTSKYKWKNIVSLDPHAFYRHIYGKKPREMLTFKSDVTVIPWVCFSQQKEWLRRKNIVESNRRTFSRGRKVDFRLNYFINLFRREQMKPTIGQWLQTVFLDIFRKKWSKGIKKSKTIKLCFFF